MDDKTVKMSKLIYRQLHLEESEKIKEIDASQYINKAWRDVDGEKKLIEMNYFDPDWPEGYDNHLKRIKDTIISGGSVLGAFDNAEHLIGICSVNSNNFGKRYKYVLLDQLFVSKEMRGKGIGKQLFILSTDIAKQWGADKFYICAGSSEETLGFYYAMGCKNAEEINSTLYGLDTRDIQLEFVFV